MKIILSPAKTLAKEPEKVACGAFSKKTLELMEALPEQLLGEACSPAISLYDGMAYRNMGREAYTAADWDYVREHVVILSALYGAVPAMMGIRPYRLDFVMKTRLGSLYKYWGDEVAKAFGEEQVVDLASEEFSRLLRPFCPERMLHIDFCRREGETLRRHSTILKKMRGRMLAFMVREKMEDPLGLRAFSEEGFHYVEALSSDRSWCFAQEG